MSVGAIDAHAQHGAPLHGGDGHGAIQHLSHQFEDLDQQNECYVVGMWTFLVTEVMFFGALFLAYSVYRVLYFSAYLDAHRFLSVPLGTVNTTVLLTSSLFMALGVNAAQRGKRKQLIAWLALTTVLAGCFLVVKYFEYSAKFREQLLPGPTFNFATGLRAYAEEHPGAADLNKIGEAGIVLPPPPAESVAGRGEGAGTYAAATELAASPRSVNSSELSDVPSESGFESRSNHAQLFFCLYFIMTGLHGIHVVIGMICMLTLIYLASRKHESVEDFMPTEMVGLYWHFVDIVWIFLFPLMYLIS